MVWFSLSVSSFAQATPTDILTITPIVPGVLLQVMLTLCKGKRYVGCENLFLENKICSRVKSSTASFGGGTFAGVSSIAFLKGLDCIVFDGEDCVESKAVGRMTRLTESDPDYTGIGHGLGSIGAVKCSLPPGARPG
ncbi:hypothetical protein Vi05172_g6953 [Venturia inaequalis]|nr:hypothetical protein Vi05172_g6953 [Venturia inaequalis]